MNKIERQMQENIQLNEGLLSGIAKLFIARKIRKQFKKAYDVAKDDPELQTALIDLESHQERLQKIIKNLCKRNPDHPRCK